MRVRKFPVTTPTLTRLRSGRPWTTCRTSPWKLDSRLHRFVSDTRKPLSSQASELARSEGPQARFDHFGTAALSDTELIALILQTGLPTHQLLQLSTQLLAQAGSLRGLMSWQPADFRRLRGIGQAKARQLAAVVEIARRMMKPEEAQPPMLSRPELVAQYMSPVVAGLEVEKFWVACLNRKNRLKKLVEVTSGTAT